MNNRDIQGLSESVRELLTRRKYAIDYYQREYQWGEKQVKDMVNDLVYTFEENYSEEHQRSDVEKYGRYFMGSIIVSNRNGKDYIIDGQQRLTTLTLLLIYLNNIQKKNKNDYVHIDELIYSEKYGQKSFNILIDDRAECMSGLYNFGLYETDNEAISIQNILKGYEYISEAFPKTMEADTLPFFIDWLKEKVVLVKITTYSDQEAFRVFETMNDRGLSLSPTEMLKGYLLSKIENEESKVDCNVLWKKRIKELIDFEKDEDSDFIKAWLRSQYAETIRERKKGALQRDYDKIGNEFHRWVRDNENKLNLSHSNHFTDFIKNNFGFYSQQYMTLKTASRKIEKQLERVFFISKIGFTLHYQLLLSPLRVIDSPDVIRKKLQITLVYLDIMLHRRLWNFRSIDYSTMSYHIFIIIREIRGKDVKEIASLLKKRLLDDDETFRNSDKAFRLHSMNKKHIRNILARMTAYVEQESGQVPRYEEYVDSKIKYPFEIEHIWADDMMRYKDEFSIKEEFDYHRNLIGGLLLLPKNFNSSFGAMAYEEKREHYNSQNILVRSLHQNAYDRNPGFSKFLKDTRLNFKPYSEFNKMALLERQELYTDLAERIWNPDLIDEILN